MARWIIQKYIRRISTILQKSVLRFAYRTDSHLRDLRIRLRCLPAVRELELSRTYAEEADRSIAFTGEKYTAPLLDKLADDTTDDKDETLFIEYWLAEALETFKCLAGREDFARLVER